MFSLSVARPATSGGGVIGNLGWPGWRINPAGPAAFTAGDGGGLGGLRRGLHACAALRRCYLHAWDKFQAVTVVTVRSVG